MLFNHEFIGRMIFKRRLSVCLVFLMVTLFLGWRMTGLGIDARFEKMVPVNHPFIQTMMRQMSSGDSVNTLRIAVVNPLGEIFSAEYMETLRQLHDEVFYLPGVDRAHLKSLWAPSVRWLQVTEEGYAGGPVIPENYDGSAVSLEQLRENVLRSGQLGITIGNDFQSSIISAPLFEFDSNTGEPLDYQGLSEKLEQLRTQYQKAGVNIHIVGQAKVFGDLYEGVETVIQFFVVAIMITFVLLYLYSRCIRSSVIPLLTSLIAVIWQLGLLSVLGFSLDLYSILVPFLVFAIGVSHGVQIINSMRQRIVTTTAIEAARAAFNLLYRPGLLALLSDAIGFTTLLVIDIQVIRELAITASIGVGCIILTNLVLLPVLISYSGVKNNHQPMEKRFDFWRLIARFADPKVAGISLVIAVIGFAGGVWRSSALKIGDLDPGAPEFHPDSRYNLDNSYINSHYGSSADLFVTYVETFKENCSSYAVMEAIDRYMWQMESVPGVLSTLSLVTVSKQVIRGLNEGNLKWQTLSRNPYVLNSSIASARGLYNSDCSVAPVVLFLADHKAETLERVVKATEQFAYDNNNDPVRFTMAGGSGGVQAATNEVIGQAQIEMLLWVYAVVSLLCFWTFRSLRAVICIIVPLVLTSVLCQALMAALGIGVKVATLPVIALGVGIGVDYGIYIFNRLEYFIRQGHDLTTAYYQTLRSAGRAVMFTGFTLAVSVGSWMFSPLKFQADMGILLTFMFIWNMVGAIWLLPALAHFVLKPDVDNT